MKHFFKTQIVWIISFSIVALITLGLIFIKTNYEIHTPAEITSVSNIIEIKDIDNAEQKDADINTVSIYSFQNISLFNYIVGAINPFADLYKISNDTNTSDEYVVAQGKLHKNLSCTNALLSAYSLAGYEISSLFKGFTVTAITNYCLSDLEIGDIITEVNGIKLTDKYNLPQVLAQLEKEGATLLNAKIIRNNKEQFVNLIYTEDNKLGFGGESYFSYPSVKDGPQFDIKSVDTLGPSGGLMQALYIYEQLTGSKLTKGLKIAGTGTIDPYGNAGLIGGIKQKIYISNANDVDIFFVPIDMSRSSEEEQYENWYEAQDAVKLLKMFGQDDMKVVKVKNLQEVIEYLEGLQWL